MGVFQSVSWNRKASNLNSMTSIFDYKVQALDGSEFDMAGLKGKGAYLLVNVARK
jgi:hypothetical protein